MSITISGEERNLFFLQITDRLTGIGDVYLAVEHRDWEAAQERGQEFADLLRFLCEDMGWGERDEGAHVLTSPPDVLRRVIGRLHQIALVDRKVHESDRDEASEDVAEAKQLQEACERVLEGIAADKL